MSWDVKRTDTFLKEFKKFKNDQQFLDALDSKLKKLLEDPENVGGYLSGKLHGLKSVRLLKNFRLLYSIDAAKKIVYLEAVDHRGDVYN